MNSQLPTIATNGIPLLDSPSSASPSKHCLSLDTSGGLLPRSALVSPMAPNSTGVSPTSKHFRSLPESVIAVDSKCAEDVQRYLNADTLVVDVRPFNLYSTSRLRTAHNICIPTTLLKRPSYDLQQVVNASSLPPDVKSKVLHHSLPMKVLVYDSASRHNNVSFQLYQTLVKFLKYDCFSVAYLDGGLQNVTCTALLNQSAALPIRSPISPATPQSAQVCNAEWAKMRSSLQDAGHLPFLSGFSLPSATAPNHKLLMSIKKNLPKLDTTAAYNYNFKFPENFAQKKDKLPKWLSFFADIYDDAETGKLIVEELSSKFNKIERTEQLRLKMAISDFDKVDPKTRSQESGGECTPLALCPCCDKINYTIPKGIENGYKNRYNNIWPYEHSRVRLISSPSCSNKKDAGDDYFNANYIKCENLSHNKYIATQNPMESTNEDFWNTVWYNGVKAIICLDNPLFFLKDTYYGSDQHYQKSNLGVKIKSSEKYRGFTLREFQLCKNDRTRKVFHFAYTEWPDFGTPDDLQSVIEMRRIKNEKIETLQDQQPPTAKITDAWDLLVHCSAGCGRTGSYISIDMVLDTFEKYQADSNLLDPWGSDDLVYKSVQSQRQQRISMVQNLDQFIYCYESILTYVVEQLISI